MKVFIHADIDYRIHRVAKRHDLTLAKAKDEVTKTDKKRASYYNYYTSKRWGEAAGYDLCLDSSVIGNENVVKMIEQFIEMKKAFEA